jgi:hypothetical protein
MCVVGDVAKKVTVSQTRFPIRRSTYADTYGLQQACFSGKPERHIHDVYYHDKRLRKFAVESEIDLQWFGASS